MVTAMLQQTRLVHVPFNGRLPRIAQHQVHVARVPRTARQTQRRPAIIVAAARDTSASAAATQAPSAEIRHLASDPTQSQHAAAPTALPVVPSASVARDDANAASLEKAFRKSSGADALRPRLSRDPASRAKRAVARRREQWIYKVSAIAASLGVTSLAVVAVYYRFAWHMDSSGGDFPWVEAAATLALTIGGAVGMELWAQYAHKALWHDFEPGWKLHKSHHVPRTGPFEDNDVFAIINAVPAMGLCAFGFLTPGVFGGLCFGTGLGITLFGISYMFIHDGLVHKRFPVGPIAEVPYLKRVAIAHTLHHSEKYDGVPWGLFLGPAELEAVGGGPELDKMCAAASAIAKNSGDNRP